MLLSFRNVILASRQQQLATYRAPVQYAVGALCKGAELWLAGFTSSAVSLRPFLPPIFDMGAPASGVVCSGGAVDTCASPLRSLFTVAGPPSCILTHPSGIVLLLLTAIGRLGSSAEQPDVCRSSLDYPASPQGTVPSTRA